MLVSLESLSLSLDLSWELGHTSMLIGPVQCKLAEMHCLLRRCSKPTYIYMDGKIMELSGHKYQAKYIRHCMHCGLQFL